MDGSIPESIGLEIIGVMTPVSICMLLVILLVYSLSPSSSSSAAAAAAAPICTTANLGLWLLLGIIVAAWFTNLLEWTTWVLLIALYDLVAVLAPEGLLKILVELASSRDKELLALVYEARLTVVGGFSDSGSVELQVVPRNNESDLDNSDYTVVAI
ncbi:hypothetical protein ACSBR2_023953 [Camellia fascicularis]